MIKNILDYDKRIKRKVVVKKDESVEGKNLLMN